MKPLNVRDIECPACGAQVGADCSGRTAKGWHVRREKALIRRVLPDAPSRARLTLVKAA